MKAGDVEMTAVFTDSEARFLRAQFDSCSIALVCRSTLDEKIVLLRGR